MKLRRLVPPLAILAAIGVMILVFFMRPPVLIVTDTALASFYGTGRILRQRASISRALFRQAKPVPVAEGASVDMILLAIGEAAPHPYCVIFPAGFADSARSCHAQSPEIPVLLMENRGMRNQNSEGVFIIRTDTETDFYRAGRFAAILGAEKTGEIVLFHDQRLQTGDRDAFSRGNAAEENAGKIRFFSHFSQFSEGIDTSCAVLAGSGAEFLTRNTKTPLILFSWLDPALSPNEVIVLFDDSPWAMALPAVKMMTQKQEVMPIPSKVVIFSARAADNGVLRKLKKAVGDTPSGGRDSS